MKLHYKNLKQNLRVLQILLHHLEFVLSFHIHQVVYLLSRFLDTLPKESRLIFMRRYWYTDSIREIAARYGMGESKVKTQLHRTRNKLRQYLEKEGIAV